MVKQMWILTSLLTLLLLLSTSSCLVPEESSAMVDSDGDGWSNTQEKTAGTDPNKVDTDDDGYWDPHDPNPLDPNIPVDKGLLEPAPEETATPTPTPTPTATPAEPAAPAVTPTVTPETAAEELRKVQDAVEVMMRNNNLTRLAHPVRVPTDDMNRFPDASTRHGTAGVGYVLILHDWNGNGSPDTNYIHCSKTNGTYICDEYGNVTQVTTGYE
ncbi:hypothetical protein ES703_117250 [subsurface metagenome]